MLRRIVLPLIFAALLFGLAACGKQDNTLTVTTTDFKFDPQSWTASAGQEVQLILINKGALEHDWVLLKKDARVTLPFDEDDEDKVLWKLVALPGETVSGTFTAPSEAGTYTVVCATPGHLEQHMEGTLVVK